MKRTRWWTVEAVVWLALLVGVGIGVSAHTTLRVLVNGKEVKMDVPPRLVGGRVLVPIRPLAEVLGADVVAWDPQSKTLDIKAEVRRVPWIVIDHEPLYGWVNPYSFIALAPIARVRYHLAELQWASINNPRAPEDPILARYEIIDAYDLDFAAGPVWPRTADGFTVQAILYWLLPDPTDEVPRDGLKIIRHARPAEEGDAAPGRRRGIHPLAVRIQRVEYHVVPTRLSDSVKDVWPEGGGPAESFIQSGWKIEGEGHVLHSHEIEGEGHVLHSHVVNLTHFNAVVPLYDLSVQKGKEADPNPEAHGLWSNRCDFPQRRGDTAN